MYGGRSCFVYAFNKLMNIYLVVMLSYFDTCSLVIIINSILTVTPYLITNITNISIATIL